MAGSMSAVDERVRAINGKKPKRTEQVQRNRLLLAKHGTVGN